MIRARSITAVVLVLSAALVPAVAAQDPHTNPHGDPHGDPHAGGGMHEIVPRPGPWSPTTLDLAESLPVQDGGRVKPLSTLAAFTLLRLNGKRSLTTPSGERLTPTAWLLDSLFFPEAASTYECFLVQDADVLTAIGVRLSGKRKRDRYSLQELEPGLGRMFTLAHEYAAIESAKRSSLEQQVVMLAENVNAYLNLASLRTLAMVPPEGAASAQPEWTSAADALTAPEEGLPPTAHAVRTGLQAMASARLEPQTFERELGALQGAVVARASARGEYEKLGLERSYYRAKPVTWSLIAFLLSFLAACALWLRPRSRWLHRGTSGLVALATGLLVAAIVMRCMIRGRPPVSTLYETVLFVTAVGALVALCVEWINRERIAISAAAFLGMVGLFVANGYETLDKQDTMPSLVAVLDTNFWLATHVTAITTGYSAGMLAAVLASGYLLAKLLRFRSGDRGFYSSLGRMVYGVLCFGVIFATVGTILGGIWANESWGRFWGWDPKENGALLIVLSQLIILHARMAGILREHGTCMAAAFGGTVVAFSWWGVNLLGVGLHSYGFTSGIHSALWTYYGVQWGIVALGGYAAWRDRRALASRGEPRVAATERPPVRARSAEPVGPPA